MKNITFGWAQIALIAILLAIPITYLVNQSQQDIRQRAQTSPPFPQKVVISGNVNTWVGNQPSRMSAELIDQYSHPIKTGVTFEWGISSKFTVGTLKEVNQNIASFYPQNPGTGDLYVKATYDSPIMDGPLPKVYIGSIPINVSQSGPSPYPTPTPGAPTCYPATIPPQTGPAPLTVTLHGGGASGGAGIAGYQWDFDGNGTWDSDYILNAVSHTYVESGIYYPKYRVVGGDGQMSQICNYSYAVVVQPVPTTEPITSCLAGGGAWRINFPNSCVDKCYTPGTPQACAQVITASCDCGVQMCWNGQSCVNNPGSSPKPTPSFTIEDLKQTLKLYATFITGGFQFWFNDLKVNILDAAYVILHLTKPSPIPSGICVPCTGDLDCSTAQYCADSGYCRYKCLDADPPCLMPEPVCPNPSPNPGSWNTGSVSISYDSFYIIANGKVYTASPSTSFYVGSDPGGYVYTTLEMMWKENGEDMRLYMYFTNNGYNWHAFEIRTYGGAGFDDWIYYKNQSPYFLTPMWNAFSGDVVFLSDPNSPDKGEIHFKNLKLQAFLTKPNASGFCQPCDNDINCSYGKYCAEAGFCRYECLNNDPACDYPDPVCN